MQNHLIAFSAFWQNDKPHGFGATVNRSDMPDMFDYFHEEVEKLAMELHLLTDMTPKEAETQLFHMAAEYRTLDQNKDHSKLFGLALLMFSNVRFLQLKNAITDDEYNGMQYAYLQTTMKGK